jgi:DNA-directed RNA polymerase subunit beta
MTTPPPSIRSPRRSASARISASSRSILEVPFLLAIQVDSYREFLQEHAEASARDRGLHAALKSVFPISSYSGNAALEYVGYKLGEPVFDERECRCAA